MRSGYFQGDFAGRLANRITQVGPALRDMAVEITRRRHLRLSIYAFVAIGAFSSVSPWLALPMLRLGRRLHRLLMRYFVPRAQRRSLRVSEDRSWLVGRIVDSYTNILTVKLFARADLGALGGARSDGAPHREPTSISCGCSRA